MPRALEASFLFSTVDGYYGLSSLPGKAETWLRILKHPLNFHRMSVISKPETGQLPENSFG